MILESKEILNCFRANWKWISFFVFLFFFAFWIVIYNKSIYNPEKYYITVVAAAVVGGVCFFFFLTFSFPSAINQNIVWACTLGLIVFLFLFLIGDQSICYVCLSFSLVIQNLTNLVNLKELNLAENKIEKIGKYMLNDTSVCVYGGITVCMCAHLLSAFQLQMASKPIGHSTCL